MTNLTRRIDAPLIAVIVNRSWRSGMTDLETFGVAAGPWRVGRLVRKDARYAIAISSRHVVGAFEIAGWHHAGTSEDALNRQIRSWAFVGDPAPDLSDILGTRMQALPSPGRSRFYKLLEGYSG